VELVADDPDGQSLLLWYPNVTAAANDYIRRATKIESGAKSALDPQAPVTISGHSSTMISLAVISASAA
jgi:hypothetical protein